MDHFTHKYIGKSFTPYDSMKKHFSPLCLIALTLFACCRQEVTAQQLLASAKSTQQGPAQHQEANSLITLLNKLQQQHNTNFVYERALIENKTVAGTINEKDRLEAVLKQVLPSLNLRYKKLRGGGYAILPAHQESGSAEESKSPAVPVTPTTVSLPLPDRSNFTATNTLRGGSPLHLEKELRGTVSDNSGSALPGVSIVIKGSQRGTTTGSDGKYTLSIPDENSNNESTTLIFSFVGYVPSEIKPGNKSVLDVVLQVDTKSLEELVVVGYGSMKKSSVTAAISKVENKILDQFPAGRAETALVGRLAGVNISTPRNTPGAAPIIRIRGAGSITASNDPLVVIDGFPGGDLANVNMNDVESIEVLKDASSAAIYGSRGSGGVIIVTTKKGKAGRPQLNLNVYAGVGKPIGHKDWISGQEYHDYIARYINRDYAWQGGDVSLPLWGDPRRPANFQVNPVIGQGNYIWEDILLHSTPIQNYNLSVRGGNEKVNYYISGTMKNEKGTLANTWYKTYSLRANIDAKINKVVNAGVMINPNFNNRRTSPVTMEAIVKTAPFVSPDKNAGGVYPRPLDYWGTQVSGQVSPLATLEGTNNTASGFNNVGELYLSLNLLEGLNLRSSVGGNISYNTAENYTAAYATSNNSSAGSAMDTRGINLVNENILSYNKVFNEKHHLNALLGASYQKATSRIAAMGVLAGSFSNDIIQTLNNAIISPTATYTTKSQWGLASYFSRINYAYKDKYLLAASFRTDGSSRFGPKNRWGSFPSASAAWRISEENFMKAIPIISELKLRASYGVVGNFNIGDFRYLGAISDVYYSPGNVLSKGQAQTSFGNDNLKWERTASQNFGVDLGIFKGRLSVGVDYYIKKTNDLLYDLSIPAVSGFTNSMVNIGDIKNSGIELEIRSKNFTHGFKWETSFNLARNKNEVVSLGGVNEVIYTHTRGMGWLLRVGEPMFSYYGYKMIGVLQNDEDVKNSAIIVGSKPGNTKIQDVNNDGKIDPADRQILGNYQPKLFMGMVNDFSWKNFDLSIVMQASLGAKMYNLENLYYQGATVSAMRKSLIENQWWSAKEPGDGMSPATALSQLSYVSNTDFYLEDASFLAIRNINLGYTLPGSIAQKFGMSTFRIYATVSNPKMFTRKGFHGYNPEGFTNGEISGINSTPGFNNGAEPINRIYALGINVNF